MVLRQSGPQGRRHCRQTDRVGQYQQPRTRAQQALRVLQRIRKPGILGGRLRVPAHQRVEHPQRTALARRRSDRWFFHRAAQGRDAVTIAQVVEHLALPPAASAAVAAPPDPRRLAAAVLGDPLRRAVYDAWLVRERRWLARVAPSRPADRLRRRLRLALRWLPVLIPVALLAVGLAWLWLER